MRTRLIATAALLVTGILNCFCAQERPNVLLICVDDLKPALGCYGDSLARSPNIDRLAASGILFEKAYVNQAVCAPSRNALMTGLRSTSLGIYDLGTNFRKSAPNAVTLGQHFRAHGWRTEALGKIFHVGHGNGEDPATWSVPHWSPRGGPPGGYALQENRAAAAPAGTQQRGAPTECADVPDNTYGDGRIADEAIVRLRAAKNSPGQPFFLAVGFLKPHLPFVAPKKYWDQFERSSFNIPSLREPPEGAPSFAPHSWGELRQYSDVPAVGPLTDEAALELIHGYYAAVSYMDAQLGRVLSELDRLGLAQNTIVVFWGDHGWHLGDHGMWCKHTNYEQATRIPIIVRTPDLHRAGKRVAALVETVDIYPTLCDLARLPIPAGLDGASFTSALVNPTGAKTKPAVFHAYPRSQKGVGAIIGNAVRTERHRLVEWKAPGAAAETAVIELYDYVVDPDETRNLAAEHPGLVTRLRAMLAEQPAPKPQIRVAPATSGSGSKSRVDRAALFERRDRDGDGRLTVEEFLMGQPDPEEAPKRFPLFDADKDGMLSRDEFIQAGKVGSAK